MPARQVFRRLILGAALLVTVLGTGGSTWSGNIKVVSYTQILRGTTDTFAYPPANSCGGEDRTIRLTSDGSFRITMVTNGPDAGFYWISPIQWGAFEILGLAPNDPTYHGRFELQPDSYSAHTGQIAYFLHLVGTGSDGSHLDARLLEHLTVGPDKVTISEAAPVFLSYQLDCA